MLIATIITDDTRFFKGDVVKLLGYSKTFDTYYVQRYDGQICGTVKPKDILVKEITNG